VEVVCRFSIDNRLLFPCGFPESPGCEEGREEDGCGWGICARCRVATRVCSIEKAVTVSFGAFQGFGICKDRLEGHDWVLWIDCHLLLWYRCWYLSITDMMFRSIFASLPLVSISSECHVYLDVIHLTSIQYPSHGSRLLPIGASVFLIPASELGHEASLVGYEVSCEYSVFEGVVIVDLDGEGRGVL